MHYYLYREVYYGGEAGCALYCTVDFLFAGECNEVDA